MNAKWKTQLSAVERTWLVTGCAGFIGSHLVEQLLLAKQKVVGLDNFSTGNSANLEAVKNNIDDTSWSNFSFIEGDIKNFTDCKNACKGVDLILHQAALGSVPRSIEKPIDTMENNVAGFINILEAARETGIARVVYASSSSIYGDNTELPKKEHSTGKPLSPYALSKSVNEQQAEVWSQVYGMSLVGLRYFNVFGERQDPGGAYAAVIPKWVSILLEGGTPEIYGDGKTSRDFCFVDNAVQANVLAALSENKFDSQIFNVSYGKTTSLLELYEVITKFLLEKAALKEVPIPVHREFRAGDVRASLADTSLIKAELGYSPEFSLKQGLERSLNWYIKYFGLSGNS